MTNPTLIWLVAYFAPAFLAGTLQFIFPSYKVGTTIIAHLLMIVSVLISFYFIQSLGLRFPWPTSLLPIMAYVLALIISCVFLGKIGFFYGLSALVQEFTVNSIAFILLDHLPLHLVILMLAPLFVLGHELGQPQKYLKAIILSAWVTLSLYLFSLSVNILYLAALHILLGMCAIKTRLIYRFHDTEN